MMNAEVIKQGTGELKDDLIKFRIPYELKELFQSWCQRNKTTPSERLRELIDLDIKEVRAEAEQSNPLS